MLNVEQSRTERLERHAARLRDRGGIFVPAQRTGVLADILLGKRRLSPTKPRSRSKSLPYSPVRVASPQRGQKSVKPIKKSDGSAKRKPRQSNAAKSKSTPKKQRAKAKPATPSVAEQGEMKVVKKTQPAEKVKPTKQKTTAKSSKTSKSATSSSKTKPGAKPTTAKVPNTKASEPAPLSVILEEDEDDPASAGTRTGKPQTSHAGDLTLATPSKPSRPRKKPPAAVIATAVKGKGKATDSVKLEDEPLPKKVPTKSATAKARTKRSAVKVEAETVPKKATAKSASATKRSITSDDNVDEKIIQPKRKKRLLASDEDLPETKPTKRSRTKTTVKQELSVEEEPKPTKASRTRKRDSETEDQDSHHPDPAPKRRRTKAVEKDETEPVKKTKASSAASKVKTVSKIKKENGVADRTRRVASKPLVKLKTKQKPKGPPQVVLDRLKNAMPQIVDDEPDEIDFLS